MWTWTPNLFMSSLPTTAAKQGRQPRNEVTRNRSTSKLDSLPHSSKQYLFLVAVAILADTMFSSYDVDDAACFSYATGAINYLMFAWLQETSTHVPVY